MKGDKMAKRSSFGSIVRRRLSDITNSIPQPKSSIHVEKPSVDSSSEEYIHRLAKENMALVKLIQDKNKVIELNGIELQKLRINLQKMQLQNWNLAQANSLMTAELNFGKEKMKTLQHEISCKEALLKTKSLEFKLTCPSLEKSDNCEALQVRKLKMDLKVKQTCVAICETFMEENFTEGEVIPAEETKLDNCKNRRPRFTRSRSVGHSTTLSQQVVAKDAAENKRRCLRRQSAAASSSKMQQQENTENLFELEDVMLMPTDYAMHVDGKQQPERTSFGGRPLRKAAEKVQSYKEIPLNVKMRRAN